MNPSNETDAQQRVRIALLQIHHKYGYPVSLAFDLTSDDIACIAHVVDDAYERGWRNAMRQSNPPMVKEVTDAK